MQRDWNIPYTFIKHLNRRFILSIYLLFRYSAVDIRRCIIVGNIYTFYSNLVLADVQRKRGALTGLQDDIGRMAVYIFFFSGIGTFYCDEAHR